MARAQTRTDARYLAQSRFAALFQNLIDRSPQAAQICHRSAISLHAIRIGALFAQDLRDLVETARNLKVDQVTSACF